MQAEPHLPSAKEVEEHNATHVNYRSWCPVCVAAAGREDPHRRNAKDEEGEQRIPTIGFDYAFYGEGAKRVEGKDKKDTDVTALILKNFKTGQLWALTALRNGRGDDWAIRKITKAIENCGSSEIRLKCDWQ